jgi:sulfonate transport system permease protein
MQPYKPAIIQRPYSTIEPVTSSFVSSRDAMASQLLTKAGEKPAAPLSIATAPSVHLERPSFLGARPRARALSLTIRASIPVVLLLTWCYGSTKGYIPTSIFSSPGDVIRALLELRDTGQLTEFLGASLGRAGLGVTLGVSVGLVLGVSSGLSALGEEIVDPTMQMVRAVPFLAMVPLFISWFGIDEQFKVALIGVASAFPMYAYSYLGVRSVDRKVVEAARCFGLGGWGLLSRVILPGALPSLLMALRLCLSISVIGLIAAEQVGTTKGIGYLVLLAKQYYRQDYMVLCILLYASLGLVFDLLIRTLERFAMPWRRHTAAR